MLQTMFFFILIYFVLYMVSGILHNQKQLDLIEVTPCCEEERKKYSQHKFKHRLLLIKRSIKRFELKTSLILLSVFIANLAFNINQNLLGPKDVIVMIGTFIVFFAILWITFYFNNRNKLLN